MSKNNQNIFINYVVEASFFTAVFVVPMFLVGLAWMANYK